MQESYDVLIVGAGPAGLRMGGLLAPLGYSVAVLEARAQFDHGSRWVVMPRQALLDLEVPEDRFRPCRGHIAYSLESSVRIEEPEAKSGFVERRTVLSMLAARLRGAELHFGHRVKAIHLEGGGVRLEVHTPQGPRLAAARVVAACDGALSVSSRTFGGGPKAVLVSEFTFSGAISLEGWVDEVHTHRYSPGLYIALSNLGPNLLTVCVASAQGRLQELLRDFIARHPLAAQRGLAGARLVQVRGGPCAVGMGALVAGPVLMVGDSGAGFPWLGGITYGGALRAAEAAVGPVQRALESGRIEQLAEYRDAWEAAFGEQYRREEALRSAFSKLTDREIDAVFARSTSADLWDNLLSRRGLG